MKFKGFSRWILLTVCTLNLTVMSQTVNLVRISNDVDYDCLGDIISYTCSITANTSNPVYLMWTVTYPGLQPLSITHSSVTEFDVNSTLILDANTTSTLAEYRRFQNNSEYIKAVLMIGVTTRHSQSTNFSCGMAGVVKSTTIFTVIVPLTPTGFRIIRKRQDTDLLGNAITFDWDPPQGSGPEAIVDYYTISISPTPLSHPDISRVYSSPWNVTLGYNINYAVEIVAENCAGASNSFILRNDTPEIFLHQPAGFTVRREYHAAMNSTVTFQWDPPQGSGIEAIVENYRISISPQPPSHPAINIITSSPWNVTLLHNIEYTVGIEAVSIAGKSLPLTLHNIEIVNCGVPAPPSDGSLVSYTSAIAGSSVGFQCNKGFLPSTLMNAICTHFGRWFPLPEDHKCTSSPDEEAPVLTVAGIVAISLSVALIVVVIGALLTWNFHFRKKRLSSTEVSDSSYE